MDCVWVFGSWQGLGASKPRKRSTKIQMLLTDGYPTLPTGLGRAATHDDILVSIKSAGLARTAGIKVHVLGLGQGAPTGPMAAVEIAKATGGTYTAVTQPEDIFNVLEESSTVGVTHLEIANETSGGRAANVIPGEDGTFTAVIPVVTGRNRIRADALTTRGGGATAYLVVDFATSARRSLEVDVFLEGNQRRALEKLTR